MHAIKKILAPIDFSDVSGRVMALACDLGRELGASVDVLHAWTTPAYVSPQLAVASVQGGPSRTLEELARTEAVEQMKQFLEKAPAPAGVTLRSRCEFGFDADTILRVAPEYDLIVMGTHGRSGLGQLLVGSVAKKVVRESPCPVVVTR